MTTKSKIDGDLALSKLQGKLLLELAGLSNEEKANIPSIINGLIQLEYQYRKDPRFDKSIPLAYLDHLYFSEYLHLNRENLIVVPPQIKYLCYLKHLNLNDNQIITVPSEIEYLTMLTTICLHNNQITKLPSELNRLKNLKHITLYGNPTNTLSNLKLTFNFESKLSVLI